MSPLISRAPQNVGTSLPATAATTRPEPAEISEITIRYRRPWGRFILLGLGATALTWSMVQLASPGKSKQVPTRIVQAAPAFRDSQDGSKQRWYTDEVSVTIDSSVDQISPQAYEAIVQGFGAWAGAGDFAPRAHFNHVSEFIGEAAQDGHNTVTLGGADLPPGHEQDLAYTTSYVEQPTGKIIEADIVINARHPFVTMLTDAAPSATGDSSQSNGQDGDKGWGHGNGNGSDHSRDGDHDQHQGQGQDVTQSDGVSTASQTTTSSACTTFDLQSVMAHEVGHFYGLGEDRDALTATMYLSTKPCETNKRDLEPSDTQALDTLYESDPFADQLDKAGCSLAGGMKPSGFSGFGLALGLTLLGRAFRRRVRRSGRRAAGTRS